MTREKKRREIFKKLINDFVEIDQLCEQAKPLGIIEIREKEAKAYYKALSALQEIELEELDEKKIKKIIAKEINKLLWEDGGGSSSDWLGVTTKATQAICSKFGRRKIEELDEGKVTREINNWITQLIEIEAYLEDIDKNDIKSLAKAICSAYLKTELEEK